MINEIILNEIRSEFSGKINNKKAFQFWMWGTRYPRFCSSMGPVGPYPRGVKVGFLFVVL